MPTVSRYSLVNSVRTLVLLAVTVAAALSSGADPLATLRDAASRGDAQAQFELGNAYWMKDNVEAASWWRKAAEQGHAEAQLPLAGPYSVGLGVPEDHAVAIEWVRKAADQGLAEAQFMPIMARGSAGFGGLPCPPVRGCVDIRAGVDERARGRGVADHACFVEGALPSTYHAHVRARLQ